MKLDSVGEVIELTLLPGERPPSAELRPRSSTMT